MAASPRGGGRRQPIADAAPRCGEDPMWQTTEENVSEMVGLPYGDRRCVAVITAPSSPALVERVTRQAVDTLLGHGVGPDDIDVIRAPGYSEVPIVTRWLVATDRYDALVVVGVVVRGDVPNADVQVTEAKRALSAMAASLAVPIATKLVVCADRLQASAITDDGPCNVGRDAVIAGLAMADLLEQVQLRAAVSEPRSRPTVEAGLAAALRSAARLQRPT
jgi:6,7-dimethyl-8-ribityllumazine synthase